VAGTPTTFADGVRHEGGYNAFVVVPWLLCRRRADCGVDATRIMEPCDRASGTRKPAVLAAAVAQQVVRGQQTPCITHCPLFQRPSRLDVCASTGNEAEQRTNQWSQRGALPPPR
jgi:hypothetical protein